MRFLLDTNVVSELIAPRPEEVVVRWVDGLDPGTAYLSVVTVGEVAKGIEKLPDSSRRSALRDWLSDALLVRFEGRILEIDVDVMMAWGTLVARQESVGRNMPAMDALIAALTIRNDLTLATRNERDFEDAGIRLFNPWRPGQQPPNTHPNG